ncbi:MAG: metalloregulator ArsR/SmtB family transcription factor [Patescibacteria group bacterium]
MESIILAALSNKVRLKLLLCLSRKEQSVTKLIKDCGLSQSAVSQHLKKLRQAGLVTAKHSGKKINYRLVSPQAAKLSKQLLNFIRNTKS